jgi:hypothetical protein
MLLDDLVVGAEQFASRTGRTVKAEGACKDDVCVPLGAEARIGRDHVDVRVVAQVLGMPIVSALGPDVDADAARPFIEDASPSHPSLIDQAHVVDELFGIVNVPNGVWIDENGIIVRPAEPPHSGRNPVNESFRKAEFELGQYLHRAGDHAAAVAHWREAHRLHPANLT